MWGCVEAIDCAPLSSGGVGGGCVEAIDCAPVSPEWVAVELAVNGSDRNSGSDGSSDSNSDSTSEQ